VKIVSDKIFEMLEGMIANIMQQFGIPGLSIGIVVDGKPAFTKGFGAKNLERNEHITPDSLFGVGSISKTFAALAIMQLVEQGKINLDDPVNRYIDFKLGKKKTPVTIHHLLSHSSGISEFTINLHTIFRLLGQVEKYVPATCWEDYLPLINRAHSEVVEEPGKIFMYNNDLYGCLGLVVEKVSNTKYSEYVRENIFKPLGMKRSTYLKEDVEKDDDVITGYILSKDGSSLVPATHPYTEIIHAPGGLLSTVRELMDYVIVLMNGGISNGNRVIQEETLKKMWTLQISEKDNENKGYGYGWKIEKEFFGETIVNHGGDIVLSGGQVAMIPSKKLAVIIGINKQPLGAGLEAIYKAIFALLLGKNINEAVPALAAQQKIQKLVGKYKTYMGTFSLEILLQAGILMIKSYFPNVGDIMVPLAPESLDKLTFYLPIALPGLKEIAEFHVDEKTGKVRFHFIRFNFWKE
jgi:CubicO group peptidase (beta-lactamase class C family)